MKKYQTDLIVSFKENNENLKTSKPQQYELV